MYKNNKARLPRNVIKRKKNRNKIVAGIFLLAFAAAYLGFF